MDTSHASPGRQSVREARRRWVMVPLAGALLVGAVDTLVRRGGGWLGWTGAVVTVACLGGFAWDAVRDRDRPALTRAQWRVWLASDT